MPASIATASIIGGIIGFFVMLSVGLLITNYWADRPPRSLAEVDRRQRRRYKAEQQRAAAESERNKQLAIENNTLRDLLVQQNKEKH
jgi:hypothetical protein